MLKVWTIDEFVATEIKEPPFLVDPLIPRFGITMMHGPAGAGKSALGFHLVEAIQSGEKFLGRQCVRANALYLNLEMPQAGLHFRLKGAGFATPAYLINHPPIEMLQQGFNLNPLYRELRAIVFDLDINCIVIDNLGTLSTQPTGNDDTARRIIATLREWFDDRSVVMIHHNRKMKFNHLTGEWVVSDEDASGSKYWINSTVSVLHVKRENAEVRVLKHTKSQVMKQLDEELKFVLEPDGIHIKLWGDEKTNSAAAELTHAEMQLRKLHPDWSQLSEGAQVELLSAFLGTSTATIYRWKSATEVR